MTRRKDRRCETAPVDSVAALRAAEEKRRRRFANAITRAAFGRHYWDDDLDKEFRDVLQKKKRK